LTQFLIILPVFKKFIDHKTILFDVFAEHLMLRVTF
jgi:hypothetical protein